jgi:hypothetical protein
MGLKIREIERTMVLLSSPKTFLANSTLVFLELTVHTGVKNHIKLSHFSESCTEFCRLFMIIQKQNLVVIQSLSEMVVSLGLPCKIC